MVDTLVGTPDPADPNRPSWGIATGGGGGVIGYTPSAPGATVVEVVEREFDEQGRCVREIRTTTHHTPPTPPPTPWRYPFTVYTTNVTYPTT